MLTKLLTFETGYHFRQIAWWLAAAAFFGLGLVTVRGNFGGDGVFRNSPYAITVVISLLSLCTIFAATVFSAGPLLRDKAYRMDALIFATPIRKAQYFGIKFAGLFVAVFTLLCLATIGIWAGSMTLGNAYRGAFQLQHYLYPLLVFGLPNVLFTCVILFSIAMRSWNAKAVYAGGVLLYILYLAASIMGGSPLLAGSTGDGQGLLPALTDPYGLAPLFGGTRNWTDAQRNTQLFPLTGTLLLNRSVWALLTTGILLLCYRAFRLNTAPAATKEKVVKEKDVIPVNYATVYTQTSGLPYLLSAFGARLKLEVKAVCLHVPFLLLLALWTFLMTVELQGSLFSGMYGIRSLAGTGQIVQDLMAVRPAILLIIFYAAELVFSERSYRIDGIIQSTPLPPALLWAGKCGALAVMAVVLVTVNICMGIVIQSVYSDLPLQWGVFASLYWYTAFPLALHGILAVFILTIVRHKFAGILVCFAVILPVLFGSRFGTEHPMLRYALPPDFKWSDMDGFGRIALVFGWKMLYWGSLAAAMAILTIKAWQQGLKGLLSGWKPAALIALLACVLVFLSTGGYIYKRMHTDGHYTSNDASDKWSIGYEKTILPLASEHTPDITAVTTHIHLFPNSGKYSVDGEYIIRNNSTAVIDTLLTGVSPEVQEWELTIPNAKVIEDNARFQVMRHLLAKPLQPGDSMRVAFHLEADRSGFVKFNSEHAVARNGSYIEFGKYLPYFGYNAGYALEGRNARAEAQLPEVIVFSAPDSLYHLIQYRTTITTAQDQTALAPGRLIRSWKSDGEAHFQYETDGPATEGLAISSARYAEKTSHHKGRDLKIYYHPSHTANLPAILDGMRASLDYCETNYAPYPNTTLVMAEIPHYPGAATAYPGLMFAKEQVLFTAYYRDTAKVNFAFATAAHETAHQWWADLLTPRSDSSYKFLTETMAKHVESRVLEQVYGREKHLRYLAADRKLYLGMRSGNDLPLIKPADQFWISYQKGALAMDTLTQVMGEARVNAGMRELMRLHTPPYSKPNAGMLMEIWEKDASIKEKNLLDRWFRKNDTQ